jgi:hypothetical protein
MKCWLFYRMTLRGTTVAVHGDLSIGYDAPHAAAGGVDRFVKSRAATGSDVHGMGCAVCLDAGRAFAMFNQDLTGSATREAIDRAPSLHGPHRTPTPLPPSAVAKS